MTIDLKNMSRKELEKLKRDVDKALSKVSEQELKAARDAAAKAAATYGYSLAEVADAPAPKKRGRKAGGTSAKKAGQPKYRNPNNADQTWTGKGRQPEWFKAEVGKGTDPKSMEV